MSPERPSWNPLRLSGTALPPNLLLVAKLLVLGMLLRGYVGSLPEPWLPMWPIFDRLPRPDLYQRATQVIFVLGAVCLLLNRCVRSAAFACGLVFFLAPIASRTMFYYAEFFCACMLMLVGAYQHPLGIVWLRAQYVVMYFGSGLNKLLDPDWRNGHYMDNWLGEKGLWLRAARTLPEGWYTLLVSWGTIATELGLAVLFSIPRLFLLGAWTAIVFHTFTLLFAGSDFGIFLVAILAGLPVFARWPGRGEVRVRRHGSSRWSGLIERFSRATDFDGLQRWETTSEPPRASDGSPTGLLVEIGERRWSGFAALNRLLLLNPAFLFACLALLTGPKPSLDVRKWLLVGVLGGLILWFNPLSEWLAQRVARLWQPRTRPVSDA